MFSRNLMRNGTLIAAQQVKYLSERLNMVVKDPKSNTIDMQDMFFRLTIDVFANIAFGVELNSILGEVRKRTRKESVLCEGAVIEHFSLP